MVAFYNAGDQALYNQGYSFIPQERFRLGDPNLGGSTTTAPVTGGINTLPVNMGGGGGGGGFNPYNPDMSRVRTDFRPNYEFRQFQDFGNLTSDQLTTAQNKEMDMYSDYYREPPASGLSKMIGSAINFIPGFGALKKGAEFVGGILNQYLPVNQRAILENQLRGQGVLTDDIGRIVAGPGGYNTPEGIMAGYNAAQMTGKTFDKRTDRIGKTLSDKYGISDADIQGLMDGTLDDDDISNKYGITTNLTSNLRNINLAKQNFLKQKNKAAEIAAFKKKQKQQEASAKASAKLEAQRRGRRPTAPSGDGGTRDDQGDRNQGQTGGYSYDSGGREGFGYGLADGGRVPYMMGGLTNLVDIYD